MAREAERHHERPSAPQLAASGIEQHRPGAEIDLRRFARSELQSHRSLGGAPRRQRPQHAPHRRITAGVTVLTTQGGVDRHTTHTLLGPARHDVAKRLDRGNRAAPAVLGRAPPRSRRPPATACRRRASHAAWPALAAPPPSAGPSAAPARCRGRNRPGASAPGPLDTETSRISCAPPRFSLWTKVREGSGNAPQFEMPVFTSPWLQYADQQLASLWRSRAGSYMPITQWLQYADR